MLLRHSIVLENAGSFERASPDNNGGDSRLPYARWRELRPGSTSVRRINQSLMKLVILTLQSW
jgi:hypothetical protein